MTATRCVIDRAISHSMSLPISHLHLGHRGLLELRFHRDRAGQYDDVASGKSAQHRDTSAGARTEDNFATFELGAAFTVWTSEEHVRLSLNELHSVLGNERRGETADAFDEHVGQHLRLEATATGDERADRKRARVRLE